MARAKGMLNLSGNIEVLAGAPFDARDIVPTKADLTVASNFPYPYVGMETYITAEDKKYRYMGGDITDLSNWAEIGSGGGGQTYNDFTGATSSTAGAHGLVPAPSAGDEGKVLFGNGAWGALPSVDLSVLSNEAFIFEEGEKPVGMWTDRKLLYAKTFPFTNNAGNYNLDVSACSIDACFLGCIRIVNSADNNVSLGSYYSNNNDFLRAYLLANHNTVIINAGINYSVGSGTITLFYTKTTDSPLPSDVKFAGVDENGNVIYKKTFTGTWNSTTTAETKTFAIASTLKLRKMDGVYHTQYGDWSINALNYNVSNNRLDYGVVAYTDTSNNTLIVERKGYYLSPLSGKSFEVDVYYTLAS